MLEFKNVSICKGKISIVKNISFTARTGKITVLLGHNGSGKSTLLSALVGHLPFTGEIFLAGKELLQYSPLERARVVSLLEQSPATPPFTVEQTVALGRNPYVGTFGKLNAEDLLAVEMAIEANGLSSLHDRACNTLSGGERQRVFHAMFMAQDTPLLLLDEPTTFMDAAAVRSFFNLCHQRRAAGKTQLVVLHDLAQAVRLADDIVILDGGRVAFAGSREECLQQSVIERHFGVQRFTADDEIFFF